MNSHLKNSEIVREKIEQYLPSDGPIEFDKLNINVQYLINVSKDQNTGVPLSVASAFAMYSMSNFASQFQWKFKLGASKIPTNMVLFVLMGSGAGKDSTIDAQAKAMSAGYLVIEQARRDKATKTAKEQAEQADGDNSSWTRYYKDPLPLENSISTVEGLTSRLNQFARDGIGMPSVLVSELGSELASNPNMVDNIRLISELYDSGNKKSKAIKDSERQDVEVKGMGMPAIFVGSEDNIILDKQIAAKFKMEFITKLARRTTVVYPNKKEFEDCIVEYSSYEDMVYKQNIFEDTANEARAFIASATSDIATQMLDKDNRLLDIDDDALQLYKDYKMYTNSLGNGTDYLYKSVQLEQMHRSWKMLKLASVYAIWDLEDSISIEHIAQAIYYLEKVGHYLSEYEEYASKDSYELIVDYFKRNPEVKLSLHEVKKRGFITGTTGIETKLRDLVRMADSFASSDGIVKYEGDIVSYKPFEAVLGEHGASFVKVSGSKDQRATQCHSGFEYKTVEFSKLSNLLTNDTAYTPFKFSEGKRKNDNIISGATWIALDVDNSDVTITEMHDMLDGINHHIGTTSNSDNPYKFRIILEFNNIVDLSVRPWKIFGKILGKELGIEIDPVTFTKSQIMFGYKDSRVYSVTDGEPFDVSECIKNALHAATEKTAKDKKPTLTQASKMLDNPLETFKYAFSDDGMKNRSLSLYRMWKQAKDLGANSDTCKELMNDLNYNYWSSPISDERFDGYIKQMEKSYE